MCSTLHAISIQLWLTPLAWKRQAVVALVAPFAVPLIAADTLLAFPTVPTTGVRHGSVRAL